MLGRIGVGEEAGRGGPVEAVPVEVETEGAQGGGHALSLVQSRRSGMDVCDIAMPVLAVQRFAPLAGGGCGRSMT